MVYAELLGETRITIAVARAGSQVFDDASIAAVPEHVDAERTWSLVQIDVLAFSLATPDIDAIGLAQPAAVAQ